MRKYFLQGQRVYMRPLVRSDVGPRYLSWVNDPNVNKYLTIGKLPVSEQDLIDFVSNFEGSTTSAAFAIVNRETESHIGNVVLNRIEWISRSADIGLMIGDPDVWGLGYPSDVLELLVPYAFRRLNLRRLYAGVLESMAEYLDAVQSLGFAEEGRWRQHSLVGDVYEDEIWHGLLIDEWESKLN
jgi:ribosomal-protein-alanine N-acetyltransferase